MAKKRGVNWRPDGYRKLTIEFIEPIAPKTIGVYGLFFDNHFYIGKSIDVPRRVLQHLREINSLLGFTLYGNHSRDKKGSYPRIVKHLIENKHISTMGVALLEEWGSSQTALWGELGWLHFLQGHPFSQLCLNDFDFYFR